MEQCEAATDPASIAFYRPRRVSALDAVKTYFAIISLFVCSAVWAQDHGHLNVGAVAQIQDAKLTFDNRADFIGDYVKTLNFATSGKYSNYYEGNITLTALHSTNVFGEPIPNAPAPGAFVVVEIVSVHGPEGGAFQFWDADTATAPTYDIPVGSTTDTFRWEVSESALGAGEAGGDPFGHIHGRRFTVTKPGLYSIGFRAVDISTNGAGGGPIHLPSDTIFVYFQGGVNITQIEPDVDHVHVTIGAALGFNWQLQSKESFSESQWVDVGAVVPGNDRLVEVLDERAVGFSRFYRIVGTAVIP